MISGEKALSDHLFQTDLDLSLYEIRQVSQEPTSKSAERPCTLELRQNQMNLTFVQSSTHIRDLERTDEHKT